MVGVASARDSSTTTDSKIEPGGNSTISSNPGGVYFYEFVENQKAERVREYADFYNFIFRRTYMAVLYRSEGRKTRPQVYAEHYLTTTQL